MDRPVRPWHKSAVRLASFAAVLLGGCSLVRLPLLDPGSVDAPVPLDAPMPLDAPVSVDALVSVDGPMPLDAPVSVDAPVCVPGCTGDVASDCTSSRDCALAGLTCRVGPSGPECVCRDGSLSCAADGRAALGCVDGLETLTLCDGAGCAAGRCDTTCDGLRTLTPGSLVFDLCGAGNDTQNLTTSECSQAANGADRTFRIEVAARSRVTVTLRDADDTVAVDTVVYLRSQCAVAASQLACGDDVPCAAAPADLGECTSGGLQYRQSSFTVDLDRGVYYVYADHLVRGGWSCGQVELVLGVVPL